MSNNLLREEKRPWPIVRCEWGSPYDLIHVLGPFSVILQPRNCYKVEFTNTSSAGRTTTKIKKIL